MSLIEEAASGLGLEDVAHYQKHGFLVMKDVFRQDEIQALVAESDRLLKEHADLIDPHNLRCRYMAHHETGEQLFEVFDPVNDISPVCERFCFDSRILSAVESLYGEPACLFKDKLIFKPAGALGYKLHQDIPYCWQGFPRSFLTVLIPIDHCSRENGCTEVFSGYHDRFLSTDECTYMLPDEAVDSATRTYLELNPGDIAIFHGLTPHRSEPNRSDQMRRVLYVSYNAQSEGGNQREAHYIEFRQKLRCYFESKVKGPLYFR